jgi:hypothetical protein
MRQLEMYQPGAHPPAPAQVDPVEQEGESKAQLAFAVLQDDSAVLPLETVVVPEGQLEHPDVLCDGLYWPLEQTQHLPLLVLKVLHVEG